MLGISRFISTIFTRTIVLLFISEQHSQNLKQSFSRLIPALTWIVIISIIINGFYETSASAAPPEGFQTNLIISEGLNQPTGFEIAPDGRMFILQRTGEVMVYKNGEILPEPFVVLPSEASGDRGLAGIALDPDYETNHYVYFYYTSSADLLNYLVRFEAWEDVATSPPLVLYHTYEPSGWLHIGGTVQFGPDGKIYLSIGDNGNAENAQDLGNPHGKIIRLNKDGSVPDDNPFVNTPGALPEIWAYGMRNPFRFQFDRETGVLLIGDVGDFSWEEINHIVPGGNYGWPICEGMCNEPGFINPIHTYPHVGNSSAVVAGPIYRGDMFPEEFNGRFIFGDYGQMFLKYLEIDIHDHGAGVEVLVESVIDFDLDAGTVVDIKEAVDGSVYYLTIFPAGLYRTTYLTDNQIPVAIASANTNQGNPPLEVEFQGSQSYDPDGDSLTYHWNFGDGTTSIEVNPVKIYHQRGEYIAQLTVSDGIFSSKSQAIKIQVGTPPSVTINFPEGNLAYKAGDTIEYSSSAIDEFGTPIPVDNMTTEVVFHHRDHIHPFLGPLSGIAQGSFTIPTTGEPDADQGYEVIFTANDANGLTSSRSVRINPQTSTYTVTTQPEGLHIFLDGIRTTSPFTTEGVVGFERTISTTQTQVLNGINYEFSHWSIGDELAQNIAVTENHTVYTAFFEPIDAVFVGRYYDNMNLEGDPVLIRPEPVIDFDWGFGSPDPSVPVDQFSASWIGNIELEAGTYRFITESDDGIRVYLDGELVIDEWHDHSRTFHYATRTFEEGVYEIRVEYYENGYDAIARFFYQKLENIPTEHYLEEFWSVEPFFSPPEIPNIPPTLIKNSPTIDYDWGLGSPDPEINPDHFIARWRRLFDLEEGTYRFTTVSDDGIRVYIDDQLIIDEWNDHSATTHSADITLSSGTYEIRVEYYENSYDAVAKFFFEELVDTEGFAGEYFNNMFLFGIPDVVRIDPEINFDWGLGSPHPLINPDNFSVRWTKIENFEAGNYTFRTNSDDGVRLYVGGELVIDNWTDHAATIDEVSLELEEGNHEIILEYYDNTWFSIISLTYFLN